MTPPRSPSSTLSSRAERLARSTRRRVAHMGILGGSRAPEHIWAPVADWLAVRSA